MKNCFLLILLFCSISFVASSQSTSKQNKVRELLIVTKTDVLALQTMDQMIKVFQNSYAAVDTKFWEEFKKEIDNNRLIDLMIPIYEKHYTEEEIQELINFYNTPIGKKTIENLPKITQESMEVGQQWGLELAQKVQAKLKQDGHLKN